ncbi:hydrolase [Bacillus sp. UMB0728]|nr:hydrolase [Bacillus sp. UMB0728]
MMEEKKDYYIDIENGQIHPGKAEGEDWQFRVFADDEEIHQLAKYLNINYDADLKTFVRSHIPFLEYHKDPQNDEYDATIEQAYALIYQLGDEEARAHVKSMGILSGEELNRR